jgi:hypothetical protein
MSCDLRDAVRRKNCPRDILVESELEKTIGKESLRTDQSVTRESVIDLLRKCKHKRSCKGWETGESGAIVFGLATEFNMILGGLTRPW